jgi:hypothetical protein
LGFGGFLKTQESFAAVMTVRVAAGEEFALGNPNAIFVPPHLNLGNWNNHQDISYQSFGRPPSAGSLSFGLTTRMSNVFLRFRQPVLSRNAPLAKFHSKCILVQGCQPRGLAKRKPASTVVTASQFDLHVALPLSRPEGELGKATPSHNWAKAEMLKAES